MDGGSDLDADPRAQQAQECPGQETQDQGPGGAATPERVDGGGEGTRARPSKEGTTRVTDKGFEFEPPCAHIDWNRVRRTNVAALQRLGDASLLQDFIGDVAMGDVTLGEPDVHPVHAKAFRALQCQAQYLLYCHQAIKERTVELENRLDKLRKHEAAAKRKAHSRKERLKTLAVDAQAQDEVLASYHAMLEALDPSLASRVSWTEDGRLVLLDPNGYDGDSAFEHDEGQGHNGREQETEGSHGHPAPAHLHKSTPSDRQSGRSYLDDAQAVVEPPIRLLHSNELDRSHTEEPASDPGALEDQATSGAPRPQHEPNAAS